MKNHEQIRREYRMWKNGDIVRADFVGSPVFTRAEIVEPLDYRRVFAIDTESLSTVIDPAAKGRPTLKKKINPKEKEKKGWRDIDDHDGKQLNTYLIPIHFWDWHHMIETPDGQGMFEKMFEVIFDARNGFAEKEISPSATAKRPKRKRGGRDGRRQTIDPILSVWFNMPYDIGRLLSDSPQLLRSVASGADSYRVRVSDRFELEVSNMILGGSSSSFEWFIRDKCNKTIVRMLGIDLTGYWKMSLANCAKSMKVTEKIDIEDQIPYVYEKLRESFTPQEWDMFKEYGIGDVQTTLELYHKTVELLIAVDARVVRRTGVIPPSAPGAAGRIIFAKAFDCHPDIEEWPRHPRWAEQMGYDSYFGGRAFCKKPGVFKRMHILDLKSAYPFQMALLPDPVTVNMVPVYSSEGFDFEFWRGKYGVLCISGEVYDDTIPPFRVHDEDQLGRLQYGSGRFESCSVTIPEIVIGIVRGSLRVDRIHKGVFMDGKSEKSFLRSGMKEFFDIKEKHGKDALGQMGKLLANASYGKLIEVKMSNFLVDEYFQPMLVFKEKNKISASIARIFASGGKELMDIYWGEKEEEEKVRDFFELARPSFTGLLPEENASNAAIQYVKALEFAGVAHEDLPACSIGEYAAQCKQYKCGHYSMPVYASQITGATSASLGLMAVCTGALQGDTDSVHVPLPDDIDSVHDMPGFDRYFKLMERAGYLSPRKVNGKWVGGLDELPGLGAWEVDAPSPTVESVLVRPKVYSHKFIFTKDGKEVVEYKQAKHGFSKFDSIEIQKARKSGKTREEKEKNGRNKLMEELHEQIKKLCLDEEVTYETRSSPRKFREAIKTGKEVGVFCSRETVVKSVQDPNVEIDKDGYVRWKPFQWRKLEQLSAKT